MPFWVRHGESTWNAVGRLQGQELSPPLTELGRQQAAEAAEQVASSGATRLLASPAVRAQQTAEIIGARLGLVVETVDALVEKGFGESWDDVTARVETLLAEHGGTPTILVTHGDVLALVGRVALDLEPVVPANGFVLPTP